MANIKEVVGKPEERRAPAIQAAQERVSSRDATAARSGADASIYLHA
jgi:hypothetical protein